MRRKPWQTVVFPWDAISSAQKITLMEAEPSGDFHGKLKTWGGRDSRTLAALYRLGLADVEFNGVPTLTAMGESIRLACFRELLGAL